MLNKLNCTTKQNLKSKKRKTASDYHALAKSNGFEWFESVVINSKTKTKWQCPKGHEWITTYNSIQSGYGCHQCSNAIRNQNRIIPPTNYHILAKSKGFKWLGSKVSNNATKTWWQCPETHKWRATYGNIQQGHGCLKCAGTAPKVLTDYHDLAKNNGFTWLGPEVKNTKTKSWWECSKGHKWQTTFSNIQQGCGCPVCKESKGEAKTAKILEALDISFEHQKTFEDCKDKAFLPFDFYFALDGKQFLIEYQGEQHYHAKTCFGGKKALQATKKRDAIKAQYAKDNGYHLILIPYTGFKTIEQIIRSAIHE